MSFFFGGYFLQGVYGGGVVVRGVYTALKFNMAPQKSAPGKRDSYQKPSFSGSMSNFGSVPGTFGDELLDMFSFFFWGWGWQRYDVKEGGCLIKTWQSCKILYTSKPFSPQDAYMA